MKKIVITAFFVLSGILVYSQCDNSLSELAASQIGTDAVFIRDFKVKLEEGNIKRPAPVARYNVYLNEGKTYRFNILNAKENESKALLQLTYKNKILYSTFDPEINLDRTRFDYTCLQSGSYQVLVSFLESRKGCASGIMSLVINDSSMFISSNDSINEGEPETLFLGIKNELHIAATDIPGGSFEVQISQGTISGSHGRYFAEPEKEGTAVIVVIAKDKDGNISETDSVPFNVKPLPLPNPVLNGTQGGHISAEDIGLSSEIKLISMAGEEENPFEIVEFSVASANDSHQEGYTSYGKNFSSGQIALIKRLKKGDRFIIHKIVVRGPGNQLYFLRQMEFVVF